MVYLDQRGCGRSEHSSGQDYSLSRLISDIEELRKFLGVSEWYILGHSFGGILAVNYAAQYPERTKGVILTNATLNMYESFHHQLQKGYEVLGVGRRQIIWDNLESFMELFYSTLSKLIDKGEYFKFQYVDLANKKITDEIDMELNSDPNFQRDIFTSEEFFQDFTSLTEKINRPVLVIGGTHDHAVGPSHHKTFNFKNVIIKTIKSSHHPYIENQKEFKEAVLNFTRL